MSQPLFSIIIAAYNSENYIAKTLDSIIAQTFNNYEIIIINDGSTDNTATICNSFVEKYNFIKLINKKNEGVAIARNIGLKIAKGNYIIFIDSDDIVFTSSLNKIHKILISCDIDFLKYEYITINEYGNKLYKNYTILQRKPYRNKVMNVKDFISDVMLDEYFLCMHIFKKNIIDKFNIKFLEGCSINEDTLFIVQYLIHCKRCYYLPNIIYGYRKHDNAATAEISIKKYNDIKIVFIELTKISINQGNKYFYPIKSIYERLGTRILSISKKNNINDDIKFIVDICKKEPILIEWKIIKYIGEKGYILWKYLDILKKINRKIKSYINL